MFGYDTSRIGPPYELFFTPLETVFDLNVLESVKFAYISSKYGHEGQFRADGSRYFDHPKGAAWIYINEFGGRNARIIIDILLHDMQEDSRLLSPLRIAWNFGEDVALDVRALTKLSGGKEDVSIYIGRIIARGQEAVIAKLFDTLHNARTLDGFSSAEKRKIQAEEMRKIYLPLLFPALRQYGESFMELALLLKKKIDEVLKKIEQSL